MPQQNSESVPQQMQPVYDEITHLTDAVCRDHFDEEFAMLCRKLAAALARKRPSPLARGKKEVWACAVMYALGQINFLFDRSQTPHTTPGELCAMFGVAQSTASNKAKQIRGIVSKIRGNDLTRRASRSSNGTPYFSWQAILDTGAFLAYAQC